MPVERCCPDGAPRQVGARARSEVAAMERKWIRVVLAGSLALAFGGWCAAAPAEKAKKADKPDKGDQAIWLEQLDISRMTCGWNKPRAGRAVGGSEMRLGGKAYARSK